MRVQTKLTALLIGVTLLFAAGLFVEFYIERQRAASLLASERQLDEDFFDRLMELQGDALATLAQDYTYWDEMVQFVGTGDLRWAHDILDTALPTYRATALWVSRTDLSLVYAVSIPSVDGFQSLPLPPETLRAVFAREAFPHFFLATPLGLVELRGAPVHPSHDSQRKTPARGYFLVGRLWDEAMVRELSEFTGLRIRVLSEGESVDAQAEAIRFVRELKGWDGQTVRTILLSKDSAIVREFQHTARGQWLLLGSFALAVLVTVSGFLSWWVARPIRLIAQSLRDQSPAPALHADASEFGDMARLVTKFIQQKADLDAEVAERKRTEQALRESEERYALAARGANEGLWDWNLSTDDVFYSPRWKSMLGYDEGEIGSRPADWFGLAGC